MKCSKIAVPRQLIPKVTSVRIKVPLLPILSGRRRYKKLPGTPDAMAIIKLICGSPDKLVEVYKVP